MTGALQEEKNITEFFTVSAEYCAFLNKTDKFSRGAFIDKSIKLLSLLYLKAAIIADIEVDTEGFVESYVVEEEYNRIHASIADLLGDAEAYYDIQEGTSYETGEAVNVSISESFADIYQYVMDFVQQFRDFEGEDRMVAVVDCMRTFKEYWGVRAARLVAELHVLRHSGLFDDALNMPSSSSEHSHRDQQNIRN